MSIFGTSASFFSDFSLMLEVIILGVFFIGFFYARRHLSNNHYKVMTFGFLINLFFVLFFMIGKKILGSSPGFLGSESVRKTVYLPTAMIHGILSVLALILAGYTVFYGYRHTKMKKKRVFNKRDKYSMHKKIGYTTLAVWFVAFVTGVLMYLMLYVIYV